MSTAVLRRIARLEVTHVLELEPWLVGQAARRAIGLDVEDEALVIAEVEAVDDAPCLRCPDRVPPGPGLHEHCVNLSTSRSLTSPNSDARSRSLLWGACARRAALPCAPLERAVHLRETHEVAQRVDAALHRVADEAPGARAAVGRRRHDVHRRVHCLGKAVVRALGLGHPARITQPAAPRMSRFPRYTPLPGPDEHAPGVVVCRGVRACRHRDGSGGDVTGRLDGKVAIVTGASPGVGLAYAERFDARGRGAW